ncbi:MAG TPA: hypothetical protein VNW54_09325, partial [Granulicella sp.]|nr:hypothetical protein [Granulicella sp.]
IPSKTPNPQQRRTLPRPKIVGAKGISGFIQLRQWRKKNAGEENSSQLVSNLFFTNKAFGINVCDDTLGANHRK